MIEPDGSRLNIAQKDSSRAGPAADSANAAASHLLLIDREVDVFSRYLVNEAPTDYIRKQYSVAVVARRLVNDDELSTFDRATLNLARRHVSFTRFTDAYCTIFHRHGVMRRKLTLLLAILEHTAPIATQFDRPKVRGPVSAVANLLVQGATFSLSLIAGTLLLLPAQLLSLKQAAKGGGRGQ